MDLQHVDVGAQALDTGFDGVEDVLAGQADLVDHGAVVGAHLGDRRLRAVLLHAKVAFGEDDQLLARDAVLFDRLGDDFLGAAVGIYVGLLWLELARKTHNWTERR